MSTVLTLVTLASPLAVTAAFAWAAGRSGHFRLHRDQFRVAAPMAGRLFEDDHDVLRAEVRPTSGVPGNRR